MSEKFYAPSEYISVDQDPTKSVEEKLEIIASATPKIIENPLGAFRITLPFVWGVSADKDSIHPNTLYLHSVDVGDEKLYRHGIGTRLLRATAKHGLSVNEDLAKLRAIEADLGLVNALIRSFGKKNVNVSLTSNDHYGLGSEKAIEEIFVTRPPENGKPYKVWEVNATFDAEQALEWELPIK